MPNTNRQATVTPITAARGALAQVLADGPTVAEIRNELEREAGTYVSTDEIEADLAALRAAGYVRPLPGRWGFTGAGLDLTDTTDGERE